MKIINNRTIVTLEELAQEDCPVLFDTCALSHPLGKNRKDLESYQINEKNIFINENLKFINFMKNYLNERNNFITILPVLEELSKRGNYNYKKEIRGSGYRKNRPLLNLRRAIKKEEREMRKLVRGFLENGRIIKLGEANELYCNLYGKYNNLMEEFNLSETSKEFLISGITFAMEYKPVILVSNNFNILKVRNRILVNTNLNEESIKFANRSDFLEFHFLNIGNNNFFTKKRF